MPPYTPHCGLFFKSDSKKKSAINNFSKEVMTEVCAFFSNQKSALTVIAFPSNIIDFQPFIWAKYKVIPNYTYRINLENSIEEFLLNFKEYKNKITICRQIFQRFNMFMTKNKYDMLYLLANYYYYITYGNQIMSL